MLMNGLIIFGAKYLVAVIALLTAVFSFWQTRGVRKELFVRALISFPSILLLARLASLLYYDTRPFVVLSVVPLVAHATDNGFPSDHTLLSAACAALVFTQNKKWGALLFVLTALVGLARILAHVHYLVDIVGSVVIASAVMAATYFFQRRHLQKKPDPV